MRPALLEHTASGPLPIPPPLPAGLKASMEDVPGLSHLPPDVLLVLLKLLDHRSVRDRLACDLNLRVTPQ